MSSSFSNRKSTGSGKKRRPTFRPAAQRKSAPKDLLGKKKASPLSAADKKVATAAPEPFFEEEQPFHEEEVEEEEEEIIVKESALTVTATSSTTTNQKKQQTPKKRKSSTGVAVGSSRAVQVEEPAAALPQIEYGAGVPTQVPDAEPGQPSLKTFCSKFRTKEKRKKTARQNAQNAPAQQQQQQQQQGDAAEQATTAAAASAGPVVQVVNGEIVLQESSVVVPGARRSVREVEAEFEDVVEEEAQHSAVVGASYNSFINRRAPQHWGVEETAKFYNALRQVGPDFATMAAYFDNRTRKQLKRKYQIESTKNPHLIELALSPKAKIPMDMSVFNVSVGGTGASSNANSTGTQSGTENVAPAEEEAGGEAEDTIPAAGQGDEAATAPLQQEEEKQEEEKDDDDDTEKEGPAATTRPRKKAAAHPARRTRSSSAKPKAKRRKAKASHKS